MVVYRVENLKIYGLFNEKRVVFEELEPISISLYRGLENQGFKRGFLRRDCLEDMRLFADL